MSEPYCNVGKVIGALIKTKGYKATKYVRDDHVIKATSRQYERPNARTLEFVVTMGRPNYAERKFIKKAAKSGTPFPIAKIQLVL